jgi:3-hydroxymyristoyl/3-hydroxydecanoyl-(acyl carrier protein) dehydratase
MMSDETARVADIAEILRLLPHRYPFLLVDCVIGMRGDDHGVGIKKLTMNEAQFGSFPETPVMPGVLVIATRLSPRAFQGAGGPRQRCVLGSVSPGFLLPFL